MKNFTIFLFIIILSSNLILSAAKKYPLPEPLYEWDFSYKYKSDKSLGGTVKYKIIIFF